MEKRLPMRRYRQAHRDEKRVRGRAKAQAQLPAEVRQQLLAAIHARTPFRAAVRHLGLTSQQVWGLTKTDETWSTSLCGAHPPAAEASHGHSPAFRSNAPALIISAIRGGVSLPGSASGSTIAASKISSGAASLRAGCGRVALDRGRRTWRRR